MTLTTIVFCIFALVTTPTSSCRAPRSWAVSLAAAVSFAITPSSIRSRGAVFSPARSLFSLPAVSSTPLPGRTKAESAGGKSARQARAAGFRAHSHSCRGIFRHGAPLEFLRAGDELRRDRQLVGRKLHGFLR